jgi:hypothetical protein
MVNDDNTTLIESLGHQALEYARLTAEQDGAPDTWLELYTKQLIKLTIQEAALMSDMTLRTRDQLHSHFGLN